MKSESTTHLGLPVSEARLLRVFLETPGPSTWTKGRQKIRDQLRDFWFGLETAKKNVEQRENGEVFEENKNREEISPPGWSSLECGFDEDPERLQSGCGDGSASRPCNTHHNISEEHNHM